jgi:hypothetical protein
MVENSAQRAHADEVARVYVGIVGATTGHSTAVVEAALAMSLTLLGERHGFTGSALAEWIETIATAATIAAQRPTPNPEPTAEAAACDSLN